MRLSDEMASKNISRFDELYARIEKIPRRARDRTRDLSEIRGYIKNWHEAMLIFTGLKKSGTVYTRDNKKVEVRNRQEFIDFWCGLDFQRYIWQRRLGRQMVVKRDTLEMDYKGKKVLFHYDMGSQLGCSAGLFQEQFVKHQYGKLDIEGRDVVDIGANVGDTAMYFALNGARHVYALEPFPSCFETAKKNIELNKLGDKITLLNAAYGKPGKMTITTEKDVYVSAEAREFSTGKTIKKLELKELIDEYSLRDFAVKMDCEGAEYHLVDESDDTLADINEIIMEYHRGYLDVKRRLSKFFVVSHTKPTRDRRILLDEVLYAGFLYARRRAPIR